MGLGAGMAVGAAVDVDRANKADDVLDQMSTMLPMGSSAVIAEVDEFAVEWWTARWPPPGGPSPADRPTRSSPSWRQRSGPLRLARRRLVGS